MKPWIKRTILGLSLAIGFTAIGGYIFLSTLFSNMCGNEVFSVVVSPNKKHKAVLFQRDCGATTEFSTQISILDKNAKLLNKSGNILTADGHPRD